MATRYRTLLLGLTLVGLGAMVGAAYVSYQLATNPAYVSPCDVNATVNCTDAYLSPYGSLLGVPVALVGLCWFVAVLLLQVSSAATGVPQRDNVAGYLFVLSVPALAFALYLAYAAFFILHTVCLLCVTADSAIIGIFVVSGIATEFSMTSFPGRVARDLKLLVARPLALIVLLLFVLGAASGLAYFPREGVIASAPATPDTSAASSAGSGSDATASAEQQAAAAGAAMESPQVTELARFVESSAKEMIPVDVQAPVIIVKFNDYQCPPCRMTYELYKPLREKWDREAPGKVKWVIKNFPLEPECNVTVKQQVHQFACEAAAGVMLAKQHNKGEALEDWIFANQPTLTLEGLKQAIHDIGNVPDFDAQYPKVLDSIKADTQLGALLKVGSTPTFFFNGVKIPAQAAEVMDGLIAHTLKNAAK